MHSENAIQDATLARPIGAESGARSPTISTVKQFCQRHPAFTEGGIRHLLFHRDSNGLAASGAVITVGRRVLLDEARFFEWLRSNAGKKAA